MLYCDAGREINKDNNKLILLLHKTTKKTIKSIRNNNKNYQKP